MTPDRQDPNDIFAKIPRSKTPPKAKVEAAPVVAPMIHPAPPIEKNPPPQSAKEGHSLKEKSLRFLWTITALISMAINLVVILVVGFLVFNYSKTTGSLDLPEGVDEKIAVSFLQGLYDNFQLMDEAHIKTDIVVEDTIPVQFDLELNQQTDVVLSENVTIYGAYVEINTGALNISAPAVVTLPEGTVLPIYLNLIVPVDKTVPVKLNVPVDIALEKTDLHEPFVGLQKVVQPLYCLVAPKAVQQNGEAVCP